MHTRSRLIAGVGVLAAALTLGFAAGGTLFGSARVTQAAGEPNTISATGVGHVPAASSGQSINVMVQDRAEGGDLEAAVQRVQEKLTAIQNALQGAGIPASAIRVVGFNVNSGPIPRPLPAPAGGGGMPAPAAPDVAPGPSSAPAPGTVIYPGFAVNATLQADVADPSQLPAALRAAVGAGATSVNTSQKGGAQQAPPDAAALAPAVAQATQQAQAMARQSAQAANLTLGSLSSLSVQPPAFIGTGPGIGYWRVQVTATYNAGG